MKQWYVYEMHEVLSPTGKPYVGSSCNFYGRATMHKSQYKLSTRPELIPIDGPYYSRKEAWHAEQPYRVANGWPDEREASSRAGKKTFEHGNGLFAMSSEKKIEASSNGGKKAYENSAGIFGMSEQEAFESRSRGGQTQGKKSYEQKVGLFKYTKEERRAININGGIAASKIRKKCPHCDREFDVRNYAQHIKKYCKILHNKP
jgi:hypothetical protein